MNGVAEVDVLKSNLRFTLYTALAIPSHLAYSSRRHFSKGHVVPPKVNLEYLSSPV